MNSYSASLRLITAALLVTEILIGQSGMLIFQSKIPQAQSRQELDSFLDLAEVSEPKEVLASVVRFRQQFAASEFIAQSYRLEMKAHQELGDSERAIAAGEQALERNPEDLDTLLTLANLLPSDIGGSDSQAGRLSKAEVYARRALAQISSLKVARSVAPEDWRKLAAQMKASAHSALGVIALKRGHYSESIEELQICISQNPTADGAQFYMLGVAYLLNGDEGQSKSALSRAAELGPGIVKTRADRQLEALKKRP